MEIMSKIWSHKDKVRLVSKEVAKLLENKGYVSNM